MKHNHTFAFDFCHDHSTMDSVRSVAVRRIEQLYSTPHETSEQTIKVDDEPQDGFCDVEGCGKGYQYVYRHHVHVTATASKEIA